MTLLSAIASPPPPVQPGIVTNGPARQTGASTEDDFAALVQSLLGTEDESAGDDKFSFQPDKRTDPKAKGRKGEQPAEDPLDTRAAATPFPELPANPLPLNLSLTSVPALPDETADPANPRREEQANVAGLVSATPAEAVPLQTPRPQIATALEQPDLPDTRSIEELSPLEKPKAAIAFELRLKPLETSLDKRAFTAPVSEQAEKAPAPLPNSERTDKANAPIDRERSAPHFALTEHSDVPPPSSAKDEKAETKPNAAVPSAPKPSQKEPSSNQDRRQEPDSGSASAKAPHIVESSGKNVQAATVAVSPPPEHKPLESGSTVEKPAAPAHPELHEPAPLRTEPVRDISFRVASATNPVDIKLVERAGQIHVAVRSGDPTLTKSLQANVTELAGKLDRSGFHTETTLPGRVEAARESQSTPNFQDLPRERKPPPEHQERSKKQSRSQGAAFEISMLQSTLQEKL